MYVNGSYEVANEQLCVNSFRRGRWIITRLCTEVMLFCSSNKARHEEGAGNIFEQREAGSLVSHTGGIETRASATKMEKPWRRRQLWQFLYKVAMLKGHRKSKQCVTSPLPTIHPVPWCYTRSLLGSSFPNSVDSRVFSTASSKTKQLKPSDIQNRPEVLHYHYYQLSHGCCFQKAKGNRLLCYES